MFVNCMWPNVFLVDRESEFKAKKKNTGEKEPLIADIKTEKPHWQARWRGESPIKEQAEGKLKRLI